MSSRRFQSAEIAFDVPDGWTDDSKVSFVFPEAATSLNLTDGSAGPVPTLAACEQQVMRQLQAAFKTVRLVERREVAVGAEKGIRLTVEWPHPPTVFRAIITFAIVDGVLWTLSASTPVDKLAETEEAIERAMRSFSVHKPT